MVSREGLALDLGKVNAKKNWKTLKNVSEVHRFLGLARFYRKFVKDFAKISTPLTCIMKKNLVFT